jgi:hypothetical protein
MSEEVTGTGSEGSMLGETAPAVEATPTTETSAEFNFRDHLSEEFRDDASLKDFKDLDGLAKSYKNAQSMIGSSVRIPGEDATAEQRAEFLDKIKDVPGVGKIPDVTNEAEMRAFYTKLGCPEKPEGYQLELPEGASVAGLEGYIEAAHEAGLTPAQLQAFADVNVEQGIAQQEQQQAQLQSSKEFLNEVFGDKAPEKIAEAKAAARAYADKAPEAVQELLNGPAGNNPALVMMLADLGSTFKEGSSAGTEAAAQHGMSANEVANQIANLYKDPAFMKSWSNIQDPGNAAAKAKVEELYRLQNSLQQG